MARAAVGLTFWQAAVVALALVIGVGGVWGAYNLVGGSDAVDLTENEQVIPVTMGDLINDVSINGSVSYPERETLSFSAGGTVAEVPVSDGQRVLAGQLLASLDTEAVSTLEKAVAQARVTVRDSEDALAEAAGGPTAVQIAQAEAEVAKARLAKQAAADALAGLLEPSVQQVAEAEARVADSRLAFSTAEEGLAALIEPDTQALAKAEDAVVKAKVELEEADQALSTYLAGPTDADLAKARLKVDSANTSLANARRDLATAQANWDAKLKTAAEAVADSEAAYNEAFGSWLGITLRGDDLHSDPDTLMVALGLDLEALFDRSSRYTDVGQFTNTVGISADDPETAWDEATVYIWQNLFPGSLVATCSNGAVPYQGACVRQELDDAWDPLESSLATLELDQLAAAKALDNAAISVASAEDGVATATENMAELAEESEPLTIESQRRGLVVAAESLAMAELDLETIVSGAGELEIEAKRKHIAVAAASLAQAEADLLELTGVPDDDGLQSARKDLNLAAAQLEQAEDDVAELTGGPDALVVALRQADLAEARATLDTALQRVTDAGIVAPWDGVISAVNVEVGQEVQARAAAIEIVDPTVVDVEGSVDEIDVLFIRKGAGALITMDALPGQTLTGEVSEIASQSTNQQGVVSYPISIRMDAAQGLELPEGLTAVANVILREDRDVLLVPLDALFGTFDEPLVRIVNDGVVEERAVVLGNTDEFWAVVSSGVAEAELVVMRSQEAQTSFGFGNFVRGLGGGGGRPPGRFGGGGGQGR